MAKHEMPGWVRKALDAVPAPPSPAAEQWEMSLAAFLRLRTDLPSLALKPLGLLDRYGAVGFGPETVGFDGEDIPWERVVRIVVRDIVGVVSDSAMEREAEHIRSLLSPVPGRKWVVDQVLGLIGGIAGPALGGLAAGEVAAREVACEIVYRGKFGREKSLQAGLFAALLLASRRPIQESLIATAREHGVAISGLGSVGVEELIPGPGPAPAVASDASRPGADPEPVE